MPSMPATLALTASIRFPMSTKSSVASSMAARTVADGVLPPITVGWPRALITRWDAELFVDAALSTHRQIPLVF